MYNIKYLVLALTTIIFYVDIRHMDDRYIIQQSKKTNLQKAALVQIIAYPIAFIFFIFYIIGIVTLDITLILTGIISIIAGIIFVVDGIILIVFSCTKQNHDSLQNPDVLGLLAGIFALLIPILSIVSFILSIIVYVRTPKKYNLNIQNNYSCTDLQNHCSCQHPHRHNETSHDKKS